MHPLLPGARIATDSEIEDIINRSQTHVQRISTLERTYNTLAKMQEVQNKKRNLHIRLAKTRHINNTTNFAIYLRPLKRLKGYFTDVKGIKKDYGVPLLLGSQILAYSHPS